MANYQLLDFGDGRKLEAIGDVILDRPCPAAEGFQKRFPQDWRKADSVVVGASLQGGWKHHRPWPDRLLVDCGAFLMPVEPTPFGHIGLFPEQRPNWAWIRSVAKQWSLSRFQGARTAQKRAIGESSQGESGRGICRPFRVLNLFAYTGASTIAAALAFPNIVGVAGDETVTGPDDNQNPLVEVVHVDAAKPNVETAKRALALNRLVGIGESGCEVAPACVVRFMVDDARKFVARELRRGRQYDLIILDPPAYGHGAKGLIAKGAAWRLERDLWPLLDDCLRLLPVNVRVARGADVPDSAASENADAGWCGMLLTGHTEGCGPAEVRRWLRSKGPKTWSDESGRAGLEDRAGRFMDAGFYMRVQWRR